MSDTIYITKNSTFSETIILSVLDDDIVEIPDDVVDTDWDVKVYFSKYFGSTNVLIINSNVSVPGTIELSLSSEETLLFSDGMGKCSIFGTPPESNQFLLKQYDVVVIPTVFAEIPVEEPVEEPIGE